MDLELVYELPEVEEKADNGKYAAIDIGVDNLAALAWNTGERPVLLKGTPLKSVNQYYNKQLAKRRSLRELMNASGTSFLDDEAPVKECYDKSRRIHRGLFQANDGRKINADVNGAYQIMRKVFPNVNADGIEGVALRPAVVALSMSARRSSGCA